MRGINEKHGLYKLGHISAWLTLLFLFLFPFVAYWHFSIGVTEFYLRQGKGFLAVNAIIAVALCSVGAAIGGYWWRLIRHISPQKGKLHALCNILLALLFLGYFLHYATHSHYRGEYVSKTPYLLGSTLILFTPFFLDFRQSLSVLRKNFSLSKLHHWLKSPHKINTVFFMSLLLALIFNNIFDIARSDLTFIEGSIFLLGRISMYLGLCCLLALFIEYLKRATPRMLHWAIWSVYTSLLIVVIIDAFTCNIGRPLFNYLNGFTALGELNWRQELKGGGFPLLADMPISAVVLICVSFFGLCLCIAILCEKASRKLKWQFSFRQLTIISLISGLVSVAEQGIGIYWKDLEQRRIEQQMMGVSLGLFAPDKGLGEYSISFRRRTQNPIKKITLENDPNIYFIMVESMRLDSITPEITPFLHTFRIEECQPIEHTWAGSNATHLSWFSIFHSLPPMHWGTVLDEQTNNTLPMGSPSIAWLHAQGYNIKVKAACDLNYKSFGITNFGTSGTITSSIEDAAPGGVFSGIGGIPEKEVALFKKVKSEILESPDNKQFHFLALDSPHYNYNWHDSFTPPFKDYLENIQLPIAPSEEEILRFRKRYWNACAWVDFQIKDFVTFLKQNDTFDDAIIVITGDHGEEFKEHGNWFHCTNLSPEQTKVPILIKWPKNLVVPEKKHASHLDIMPSILYHLGASPTALQCFQGKNLLIDGNNHTTLTSTNYPGASGYTMRLSKENQTYKFSRDKKRTAKLPYSLVLDNIQENGIPIPITASSRKESSRKSLELLQKYFPDTFKRFFHTMVSKH